MSPARNKPILMAGGLVANDRGELGFVEDFHFAGVKRFYTVANYRQGFIRAHFANLIVLHHAKAGLDTALPGAEFRAGR